VSDRSGAEPRVLRVPGDKSISHRALLLASIASGESRLRNVLPAADPQATATALRALGCTVPALAAGQALHLPGVGLRGWRPPRDILDCGNSGTTARLLLGALAAHRFVSVLDGDASLRSRPMRRVTAPLAAAGARFEERGAPDRLPIAVHGGPLGAIEHDSPHASAQVKSALALAGLLAGVPVVVTEPSPSRDHTERMLAAMGATVATDRLPDGRARLHIAPAAALEPLDLDVPGDISSATFLLVLGLLGSRPVRVEHVGLNPTRTGALAVLRRMGGWIDVEPDGHAGGEPFGHVTARPSELRGTVIDAAEVPALIDEIPVLAVAAARARGETRITGARELRVKESDRIATIVANLRAVGGQADELEDGLVVQGGDAPLAGRIDSAHDHRIAMSFGVLGRAPACRIDIDDPSLADVSFPGFWRLLEEA
jgi:3-phosphoshikimate 1-carboxyvinyltransferase